MASITKIVGDGPELYTPFEAAAILGIQAKRLGELARAGKLNGVRTLGGHRRYPRAELERYLTERGQR